MHNRSGYLREALSSVYEQHWPQTEILIVDDGSTDDTPDILVREAELHPEITVIRQKNQGPGAAREQGRLAAKGEYIQYLDSDDLLYPGKFIEQIRVFHENPRAGICYCGTELIDEKGKILESPYKGTGETYTMLFPRLLIERWWNTQTPLWTRAATDAVGPWPQGYMAEDWRYDARAGGLKIELAQCEKILCATRKHSGTRLTGHAFDRRNYQAHLLLVEELLEQAAKAGLSLESPEMKRFQRWVFSLSRRSAASGNHDISRAYLEAGLKAYGHQPPFEVKIFSELLKAAPGFTSLLTRLLEKEY